MTDHEGQNTHDITLDLFMPVADGAGFLLSNWNGVGGNYLPVAAGQVFHPDGWNVIIAADDDNC